MPFLSPSLPSMLFLPNPHLLSMIRSIAKGFLKTLDRSVSCQELLTLFLLLENRSVMAHDIFI
jgi:hypothetical protein